MNRHKLRDPLEWKVVSFRSAPILRRPDSSLDVRNVLVGTSQVDHRATRHHLNQCLQGCEFAISVDDGDAKATLEIALAHLLESLKYFAERSGSQDD